MAAYNMEDMHNEKRNRCPKLAKKGTDPFTLLLTPLPYWFPGGDELSSGGSDLIADGAFICEQLHKNIRISISLH